MSASGEEDKAVPHISGGELTGDSIDFSAPGAARPRAPPPQLPPLPVDNRPEGQPKEQRPCRNNRSPHHRRKPLNDISEHGTPDAWCTETASSSEYMAALGPPQSSSSPVKLGHGQLLEYQGEAAVGGAHEGVAEIKLGPKRVPYRSDFSQSVGLASPAEDLHSPCTLHDEPKASSNRSLKLPDHSMDLLQSSKSGQYFQTLHLSLPKTSGDCGYNVTSAELECNETSNVVFNMNLDSSFAGFLPGLGEDMKEQHVRSSIGDTSELLGKAFANLSTSADEHTPPEEGAVSGVKELERTPASYSRSSSSSFQTAGIPLSFSSRKDTLSRAGWKLDVKRFDPQRRKVKPDTPRPQSIDKRTNSSGEALSGHKTIDPRQDSRTSIKPRRVQFKVDAGTRHHGESVKAKAQGLGRHTGQTTRHRSGNTLAMPLTDVTAQLHNITSPTQSFHTGKSPPTSKDKFTAVHKNKGTASPSLSSQQFRFKLPMVPEGAIEQSSKTKWRQQQRMKPVTEDQQHSGQGTRNSLHLNPSPSRGPTPKRSHMSINKLQLHSSANRMQVAGNLSDYNMFHAFVTPNYNSTGRNSCSGIGHQQTGIPIPRKGLQRTTNGVLTNLMRSGAHTQLTHSSRVPVGVEQTPPFCNGSLRDTYTQCQEPLPQRTFSGANNQPGILLSDEIPTRDGESGPQQQLTIGLSDPTRGVPSGFLVDTVQRVQTASSRQDLHLGTINSDYFQQSATCGTPDSGKKMFAMADVSTQTALSVSSVPGPPPTALMTTPVCNLQQYNRGESAYTSVVTTPPNSLQGLNTMLGVANQIHTGLFPVCQTGPLPIHPQPSAWQQSYQIPVSFPIHPPYVPLHRRYTPIPRLPYAPWVRYPALTDASVNFPYSFHTSPVTNFPPPRVYYSPPVETTWLRPPSVYYSPPCDRFWQPLPCVLPYYRHTPVSRQGTNERITAWLQQVATAQRVVDGGGVSEEDARATSSAAMSSDSGIQDGAALSSLRSCLGND